LPLEIGAFEKIIATPNLGMCDEDLEHTLVCWTSRREYCRQAVMLGARYDLQGNQVGSISQDEMQSFQERYVRFIRRGML